MSENLNWFYLYIEDHNKAFTTSSEIMEELFDLMALTRNNELCIFSRIDDIASGTHFYFAPSTKPIAIKHNAKQCEKPLRQEAGTLLAGNQSAVDGLLG